MLTCSSRTQAVQTGWIFSAFRLGAGCWSEQPRSSKWESLLGQQTWTIWKLTSVSVSFHLSWRNPAVMNYSLLNLVIFFPPVAFLWVGIIFEECLVWWCGRILYSLSIAMTPLLIHTVLFHHVWFIRITLVPLCLNSGTWKALFCFVFWWIFTGLKKRKEKKRSRSGTPGDTWDLFRLSLRQHRVEHGEESPTRSRVVTARGVCSNRCQCANKWGRSCSIQLYLWTLKFEFRIIYRCHEVCFWFFVPPTVQKRATRKPAVGWPWPAGHGWGIPALEHREEENSGSPEPAFPSATVALSPPHEHRFFL